MNLLFSGPFGSGKTRILAEKANFICLKFKGIRAALVRKELKHLKATTMYQWDRFVVHPLHILDFNKQDLIATYINGSELWFVSPERIASYEFGWIGVEEAIELQERDWDMIQGRIRDPQTIFHQLMLVTNPGAPGHFLHREFYRNRQPGDELIEGQVLWDLLPASYRIRLSRLKGLAKQRYVEGKWVAFEGLVFDVIHPNKHFVKRNRVPPKEKWATVEAGVDWGYTNPGDIQVWIEDKDANYWMIHEVHMTHKLIGWWVDKGKIAKEKYGVKRFKCDPTEPANIQEFRRAGLNAVGASTQNKKQDIQNIYQLMAEERLFIVEDALEERDFYLDAEDKPCGLLEEVQCYKWDQKKDDPIKEDDHACDGMRYKFSKTRKVGIDWA